MSTDHENEIVFIIHGGALLATTRGESPQRWNAKTPTELIAKLDADGIDRERLYLVVPDGITCPDHALSSRDAAAFIELLGPHVERGA